MDLDSLLEDSSKLEKTITALIENNALKQSELCRLNTCLLDRSQYELNTISEKEKGLRTNLETLRVRKNDVEAELKQFTDINEKLSHWVSEAQKSRKDRNQELYVSIADTIRDYEQLTQDYRKVFSEIASLRDGHEEQIDEVRILVEQSNELVVSLRKNENMIKVLEQQNKFSEQQFDLIINQLPWEPLTNNYIEELRNADSEEIKAQAEFLQIQASEIHDLSESVNSKKQKKLEILEQLANQLNKFVQKREEATLIDEHSI